MDSEYNSKKQHENKLKIFGSIELEHLEQQQLSNNKNKMHQSEINSSNTRAESPNITTTTTTQSVSSTSNHSTIVSSNGQYNGNSNNGNKGNNSNEQQSKNRICRDFVRGSCRRLFCKYPHVQSPDLVVFCHDYQNNKCPRLNCKFLHYTIDEEEHYRKYGEFPLSQQDDFSNNQNINNVNNVNNSVNHDYSSEYEYSNKGFFSNNSSSSNGNRSLPSLLDSDIFHPCQQRIEGGCSLHCHNNDRGFSSVPQNSFRNSLKRLNSQERDFMQQQSKFKRCREDDILIVLRRFEEEHQMLKRRVEANELKIAELRASNEYLMTQNAQLRLSTVQVSRVVNPVTVTNSQSQQQTQTQVISASMAPVQNPQVISAPIVSMAAPQTQIIATPPNVPPIVGTIHTNGSQQTQQNLITLAPAAVPSIGLSINTSQALAAISNANQPIISYPIMTHSILPH